MKTIYLSSEMTGLDECKWRMNFLLAETNLSSPDSRIINPAYFKPDVDGEPTWCDYIVEDIRIICDNCDCVFAFGKWWTSPGSLIEILTAIRNDKKVLLSKDTPWYIKTPFRIYEKKLRRKIERARKEKKTN